MWPSRAATRTATAPATMPVYTVRFRTREISGSENCSTSAPSPFISSLVTSLQPRPSDTGRPRCWLSEIFLELCVDRRCGNGDPDGQAKKGEQHAGLERLVQPMSPGKAADDAYRCRDTHPEERVAVERRFVAHFRCPAPLS